MIRTRLTLEELSDIMKFPHCPCLEALHCQFLLCGHWDMWVSCGRLDLRYLASMYGESNNDLYYKYKDHIFVAHWVSADESVSGVFLYLQELDANYAQMELRR